MEKQRSCPICYENYDNVEAGVSSCVQLDGCEHDFCRDCWQNYCLLTIQEHENLPITCPSSTCDQRLPEEQLHNVLCSKSHELESCTCKPWVKYQQRVQMQRDPSLVPCTKCEAFLSPSSSSTNTLHCSCGQVFCLVHGDAHPNMTCEEHQNCAPSTDQMLSETAVRDTTKPCPHCNTCIELSGGCEHVVCSTCHNDFCYKCGRYEYLVGNMIRTCTLCNQSYMDHRKLEKQRLKASVLVHNTASRYEDEPEKQFNFATFPQLEECLNELEGGSVAYDSQSTGKSEDASTMIKNCRRKLKLARSKLNLQLDEIDDILAKIPKPKKKKTDGPLLVDQQLLMKMLTQFNASQQNPKKKRKHSNAEDIKSKEEEGSDDSELQN